MAVNLYTVRVLLDVLGASDYGIYNVVGGVVMMFTFLTSTMVSASQRFFAFELGRKSQERLNQYFNLTILCYLIIAVVVLVFAETVGLWFVNTQMVIPADRLNATNWVYQFSILAFMIHMMVIPYNSVIIAREKMNVYAYVSIIEVILKLTIVFLLMIFSFDKLKLYAILTCGVTLLVSLFYFFYCKRKYQECKLKVYWDKPMFKELMSYSGWSLFGTLSAAIRSQGINILLNVFFGPIVNAARSIAFQISGVMNQFTANFFQAVRPQITKQYANGEKDSMMMLMFRSSRFCFYLILILSLPVLIETPYILSLWLKEVPDYTVLFIRLVVINAVIESMSYPLMASVQATGNIKWYQIIVGGLLILNLPISYIALKLGGSPQITMYIAILLTIIAQTLRLFFMEHLLNMSIKKYLLDVVSVVLIVTLLSGFAPVLVNCFMKEGVIRFGITLFISVFCCAVSIYAVGITKGERKMVKQYAKKIFRQWL